MNRILAAVAVAVLMTGCAPTTRVVLLPQDGMQGAVDVQTRRGSAALEQPYAVASVYPGQSLSTGQMEPKAVQQRYRDVLAVQPAPAQRFTLYFELGGAHLTPESTDELTEVLSRASARPGGEIFVIGHTDTVGSTERNDALSLERALAIREMFIARGFDPARVEAIGRGERELIVPTADNVQEPRNRRAEIIVR